MTLYRANDRWELDETFLIVSDPEEFRLFQERKKHEIRGVMMHTPMTEEEETAVLQFVDASKQNTQAITGKSRYHCQDYFIAESEDQGFFQVGVFHRNKTLTEAFSLCKLPKILHSSMEACMQQAKYALAEVSSTSLRINTLDHKKFMTHEPAYTKAFRREGTEIVTPDGRKVLIPQLYGAAFDGTVIHRAKPIPLDSLASDPRVNCVIA